MSVDFPMVKAYNATKGNSYDAFVAELSSNGSNILYSTFVGGSGTDAANGITVDQSGFIYITGYTSSTNFPTLNAITSTFQGGTTDVFVTKLGHNGTFNLLLAGSTYIGGNLTDTANAIAIDGSRNVYITGYTASINFPTKNAFNATYGGNNDAFVLELNSNPFSLVYSTYIGGNSDDFGFGIATDINGNSYVTGSTRSTNFPIRNAYDSIFGGYNLPDIFIVKLNSSGSLIYSTYLGGSGLDNGYSIAIDTIGNAYITGYTRSTDFPTINAYNSTLSGTNDIIVLKLSSESDSTKPLISITSPGPYTSNAVISYSISEKYLKSTVVYLDSVANSSDRQSGYVFTSLSQGQHNITIYAIDFAGNNATQTDLFIVDTISPNANILTPLSYYYRSSVILTYTITEVNLNSVIIYLDGYANNSLRQSGYVFTSLSEGLHNITILISDKAGNIGSQEVLFNVDLTPPIINIISPSATGFNSSVGLIYSITEDHIKTTKIFLNGISNTSIRQSGYNYSLAEGSYNITLIVTDLAGNNASQTVLFYIDMEKPNILLINPTTGIYQKPNSIINISVTDDHSLLKVEYKWDTADKFSSFVLSNGSYISLLINSDGNHTITIFATDVAGNIALMSFSFITDGTAPEIVLLSPENSAILHTDTLINISITDNFAVEKALFNWDGTENSTFSPPYSINLVAINGTHRLNVFAEDLAGNWISQSYLFTIILPSSASLLTESIIIVAGIVIVGGTGLIGVTFTVLRRRHQKEVNDNIDKLLDSYGKSDKSKKS